ncbi:MAG: hypothetical protein ACJ8AK_13640 [Gemmatimonadaceae bacterium]
MQWPPRGSMIGTPSKRIGFFIVTLATVACGSASGPRACGDEYRIVADSGEVALADGLSFVDVSAMLRESRKPGRPETQIAQVGLEVYAHLLSDRSLPSDFLHGHVTTIDVRDAGTPSRLIKSYVVPNPPPFLAEFSQYGMAYDWSITVDEARALFVADQFVIEVHTDLPSQPLVRIVLKGANASDPLKWSRTIISGGDC